jgi:hypothetical protein
MLSIRKIVEYITKMTTTPKISWKIILVFDNNKSASGRAYIIYSFIKRYSSLLAPQLSEDIIILNFTNGNKEQINSMLEEHFKNKENKHENKSELKVHNAGKFIS